MQGPHQGGFGDRGSESRLGVVDATGEQQRLHIVESHVVVVGCRGACPCQAFDRVALLQRRFILRHQFFLGLTCRRHMLVQEFPDLAFRQRAHETVNRLAVHQQDDRGKALDAKCGRELLLLVGIDLHQLEAAGIGGLQLFQQRADHLAGAAPGGPEVHQHRLGHRGGNHLGFKVF